MPRNYQRRQTLVPWYHEPKPRCITTTLVQERCSYSATYETADGRIQACKIHADMLAIEGVKLRKIRTKIINIRNEDAVTYLRGIS